MAMFSGVAGFKQITAKIAVIKLLFKSSKIMKNTFQYISVILDNTKIPPNSAPPLAGPLPCVVQPGRVILDIT